MLKPFLARVFARVARLLGIPEIQHRLDHADAEIRNLRDSHRTDPRFGTLERHLERRTQQQIADQAALTQQQLADQAVQTQALAQQQAQQQAQLTDLRQLLNEAQQSIIASTTAHLESVVNAVQASLIATTTHHTEQVVNEVRAHLETELNVAKRDLDNIRRMASTQSPTASASASPTAPQAPVVIDDALYISLEDHFRGDKATVHQRQMEYLPYISGIVSEQFPLIDLGCGRGEWLQVLKDNHIAARGIDSNTACVAECTENGLLASLGELLDTLSKLPDASCGSITMFQVLEHLPFDVVVNVLREARRVLIPGGVFIGEVPNSETLRVGASTFWIDPTHQRPLFPAVLAFLASSVGFAGVTGKYSSPLAPTPDLTGLPDVATRTILDLHHAINGPGDFALIATA